MIDTATLDALSDTAIVRTERALTTRVAELVDQLTAAEGHLAALTGRREALGLVALPIREESS